MSIAVTHQRHHIHIPWMPVIAVALAVAVAAAVLVLVNQPTTSTVGESTVAAPAVAVEAAAVALPESPALRHQLSQEVATAVPQDEQFAYARNHVMGVTLSPSTTMAAVGGQLGASAAPNDPYPHNHFPSAP